ncbi:dual specificity protein phosphatase 13B isoform X1 [Passer domesticus]|uniref:dual specificity protein phosphatase 13B isoform X1 n=1 Tax=Passer domesticus TaxID=48849 RepID=UPI0030FE3DC9
MAWDSLCSQDLRRPRIRSASSWMPDSGSSTGTPSLEELRRLLCTRTHPTGHVDEVWPNLYVGDLYVARDKAQLSRMGISHVVNAAAGRFRINTGPKFYSDLPVDYYGVEAEDNPNFDLSIHFYPVAQYIREALNSPRDACLKINTTKFCNAIGLIRKTSLVRDKQQTTAHLWGTQTSPDYSHQHCQSAGSCYPYWVTCKDKDKATAASFCYMGSVSPPPQSFSVISIKIICTTTLQVMLEGTAGF